MINRIFLLLEWELRKKREGRPEQEPATERSEAPSKAFGKRLGPFMTDLKGRKHEWLHMRNRI
jgi:hypothetical protein